MIRAGRIVMMLILVRWTAIFLIWPMREDVIGASFLHSINLPFHEAGHILFSPLGEFMTTLGGSLMQALVPTACAVAFLTTHWNPFGAAVMGWWAGENLMDVAVYINDARSLALTLIGGGTGAEVEGHDWERILMITDSLHLDHTIARIAQFLGAAVMIGCLVWALIVTIRAKDAPWPTGKLSGNR